MADQPLVSVEGAQVRVELHGNCVLLDLELAPEFEQRFLAALLAAELATLDGAPTQDSALPSSLQIRPDQEVRLPQ